jgi:MHS family proline/betaine transporter-like MFS transporter
MNTTSSGTQPSPTSAPAESVQRQKRVFAVGAGTAGNILEWFDYGIYGQLAAIISAIFFPSKDPLTSLLYTFVVFGVGFVMRPIGGMVFGHVADKYGRKIALSWTIIIMAGSTFVMGLIPPFARIGVVAPLMLAACRLLQGFSTGGEWGGATAFIVEYAPENRRGFYGSFQQVSNIGGVMLGSLTAVILTYTLSQPSLVAWGWRLPFVFGITLGVIGWYMRTKLEDTPAYKKVEDSKQVEKSPIKTAFGSNLVGIIKAMGLTAIWTVAYYILLIFMPTYINKMLKIPLNRSLLSNFFSFILLLLLMPFFGHLSDKIGRKPILLTSCLGYAVCTYPLFVWIGDGNFLKLVIAQLILGVFLAMFSGAGIAFSAEIFPTAVRVSTLSIGYNIMVAAAGGMAPFIATYLIKVTGNNVAPAFYVVAAAIISGISILTLPETYNKPLK